MASLVTSKSTHLMYESSDAAEVMPEIDGGHTGPLYTEWRKRETLRIQRAITSAVITAEEENTVCWQLHGLYSFLKRAVEKGV